VHCFILVALASTEPNLCILDIASSTYGDIPFAPRASDVSVSLSGACIGLSLSSWPSWTTRAADDKLYGYCYYYYSYYMCLAWVRYNLPSSLH
jgi:hypothetical protein